MAARFRRLRLTAVVLGCLFILLAITHVYWLRALGWFLVYQESPIQADAVVVLAGDFTGARITKAAELVKAGYAPKVIVSGPSGAYGVYECDLAIGFIVKRGYPAEWFHCFRNEVRSTVAEAEAITAELHRLNIRRFLLVTSNFHTRRSHEIFKNAARNFEFRTIAAPHMYFDPDNWWREREARKAFLFEWMKTVATWVGL